MAFDKKSVLMYAFYEMAGSYFKNCEMTNQFTEQNLCMHFRDASPDFQCDCEDYVIYSVENTLPSFIDKDFEQYDAKMRIDRQTGKITVITKDFTFDVIANFKGNKPSLFYTNFTEIKAGEG